MKNPLFEIILLCVITMLALSGCDAYFIGKYGYIAHDADMVRDDGKNVVMPENAPSVSQGYKPAMRHNGIDIYGEKGIPVIAASAGVVTASNYEPFYGNRVVIDHGRDGDGAYIRSRYFHLDKRTVETGERVVRGQQIGSLGSTGLLASFPHLHFEIRSGADPDQRVFEHENPHGFWADGVGVVTCFDITREWEEGRFRTTYPVPCLGVDWQ